MRNINPHIGDGLPYLTSFYKDVPNGYKFSDLNDSFLTPFIDDLERQFNNYEIVGDTYRQFFNLLKLTWSKNYEIVKKYAEYDKDNIHFTYDTVNKRVIEFYENGESSNTNSDESTHIDVPLSNDDSTPSTVDNSESSNSGDYSRNYANTETLTLDDGDRDKVNKLTYNYKSVLEVLIDVFKPCFMRIEIYNY